MANAWCPRSLLLASLLSAVPAGAAAAGEFDKLFFVKPGGKGAAMLEDRAACAERAARLDVEQARGYSDPEFGSLAAMASALEGEVTSGKLRATVRRVALERCMERRGWTLAEPTQEELKLLRKASRKRPEALDAWLRANESKAALTPPGTPSAPIGKPLAGPT
jgi:hypothetical protein